MGTSLAARDASVWNLVYPCSTQCPKQPGNTEQVIKGAVASGPGGHSRCLIGPSATPRVNQSEHASGITGVEHPWPGSPADKVFESGAPFGAHADYGTHLSTTPPVPVIMSLGVAGAAGRDGHRARIRSRRLRTMSPAF